MHKGSVMLSMLGLVGVIHAVVVDDHRSYCGCIILRIMNDTEHASLVREYMETITISPYDRAECFKWDEFPNDPITRFPKADGKPTTNFTEAVGIYSKETYRFCGPPSVKQKFLSQNFASSTVGLLLPYIALCAQLGMQTGSVHGDLLSILLSLGSPVWVCASIAHAVLYRRAVHKRFGKLRRAAVNDSRKDVALFVEKCDAAETILQSFLQAPVRLSTRPGFLSSLIILPQNHGWWLTAAEKLKDGQRKMDAAYLGQNMVAIVTWLLSIVADFGSIPGAIAGDSGSAEWQISMGTLFLWLFVATFGPIAVKSQYNAGAINKALRSPWAIGNKFSIPLSLEDGGIAIVIHEHQTAIEQRTGLNSLLFHQRNIYDRHNSEFQMRNDDTIARESTRIPTSLGVSVNGDEGKEGPIYFSARLFTSWWASEYILQGFETWQERLEDSRPMQSDEVRFQLNMLDADVSQDSSRQVQTIELIALRAAVPTQDDSVDPVVAGPVSYENIEDNIVTDGLTMLQGPEKGREEDEDEEQEGDWGKDLGKDQEEDQKGDQGTNQPRDDDPRTTPEELDSSLCIVSKEITAYPEWTQISSNQKKTLAGGYIFGLVALWGTCGPSLYVHYTTPPVGLGCLSGGILLYAVLATVSSLFIAASILLSHAAVLHYQRRHLNNPTLSLSPNLRELDGAFIRTAFHFVLCNASVIANNFGKFVAVINAFWILLWSFLSYSNVMDVPFCTTAYLTLRNQGWTRLWIFSADQFKLAAFQELGSLSAASIVALCLCVLIYNLTSERRSPTQRWRVTGLVLLGFVAFVSALTYVGVRSINGRRSPVLGSS